MNAVPDISTISPAKRWAVRLLAEHQRKGGKRYALAVLVMAKRALGIELNEGEGA